MKPQYLLLSFSDVRGILKFSLAAIIGMNVAETVHVIIQPIGDPDLVVDPIGEVNAEGLCGILLSLFLADEVFDLKVTHGGRENIPDTSLNLPTPIS